MMTIDNSDAVKKLLASGGERWVVIYGPYGQSNTFLNKGSAIKFMKKFPTAVLFHTRKDITYVTDTCQIDDET